MEVFANGGILARLKIHHFQGFTVYVKNTPFCDQRPKKIAQSTPEDCKTKDELDNFLNLSIGLSNFWTFRAGFLPYTAKNKNSDLVLSLIFWRRFWQYKKIRIQVGLKITSNS